jgi:hypothetical protein
MLRDAKACLNPDSFSMPKPSDGKSIMSREVREINEEEIGLWPSNWHPRVKFGQAALLHLARFALFARPSSNIELFRHEKERKRRRYISV